VLNVPVQYALIISSSASHEAVDDCGATTLSVAPGAPFSPSGPAGPGSPFSPMSPFSPLTSFARSEQLPRASPATNVTIRLTRLTEWGHSRTFNCGISLETSLRTVCVRSYMFGCVGMICVPDAGTQSFQEIFKAPLISHMQEREDCWRQSGLDTSRIAPSGKPGRSFRYRNRRLIEPRPHYIAQRKRQRRNSLGPYAREKWDQSVQQTRQRDRADRVDRADRLLRAHQATLAQPLKEGFGRRLLSPLIIRGR
jgi:hypothetical protein